MREEEKRARRLARSPFPSASHPHPHPAPPQSHFIAALKQACFIQDRETAMFSRCGRTDRGVSAFGQVRASVRQDGCRLSSSSPTTASPPSPAQVLSLRVRTNETACKGFMGPPAPEGTKKKGEHAHRPTARALALARRPLAHSTPPP